MKQKAFSLIYWSKPEYFKVVKRKNQIVLKKYAFFLNFGKNNTQVVLG